MFGKSKTISCGHESDIVSYIYDELTDAARSQFESHLAECGNCIDEFAAVSYSRFSVFEYQKQEFAHLATPMIRIPYGTQGSVEGSGLVAAVSSLIAGWRPAFVAAALVVVVSTFFLMYRYRTPETQTTTAAITPAAPLPQTPQVQKPEVPGTVEKTAVGEKQVSNKTVVATAVSKRTTVTRQRSAPITKDQTVAVQPAPAANRAPRLSTYDDTEDRSLRLSDLFENEVGIR